ncbi:MAG TPA: glycogen synthase GlgA [Polyangiaceae bacterium]|nr:glycogen synthase GlgA [Polyangiaceae bacterium]
MDILFVATELSPLVKVGGLADVVGALSKALRQLGHKVTLAMPRMPPLERGGLLVARRLTPLTFSLGDSQIEVTVYDGRLGSGVELVLFDAPGLYDREGVYGEGGQDYADNARRFAVFSRAAAELIRQRAEGGTPFDVVHVHDWPAALVPVYLRELERARGAAPTPVVLTVHNLAHQGIFPRELMPALGLRDELFAPDKLEFYGKINFLKGGLVFADKITTVSATYAREIQTEERGHGLEGVLATRTADLYGITNGIDYATWNPATDAAIVARYDAEDPSNKERCKTAILRELDLPLAHRGPLVLHVGRMVVQKGTDLCVSVLPKLVFAGATLVLVGDGDAALIERATQATLEFPEQARFLKAAPEATVHRLFAGADIVLVPSRFEPCGLVQLYGQRYGALPVAHATGGLRDTIVDADAALETGTGFLFDQPDETHLLGAAQRAIAAHASPRWPSLRRRAMRLDLGWDRPARRYDQIYRVMTSVA